MARGGRDGDGEGESDTQRGRNGEEVRRGHTRGGEVRVALGDRDRE